MRYAVIDLETTGGSAAKDRITEIAIVVHDGERIVKEFSTLVNPERPIPPYITDITGITDDMVLSAPRFYEIAREVVELTDGCTFVAHNVNFDYGFLREEFSRLAYNYERERACTVRMSRQLIPGLPSYSLGRLCQHLGIEIHARHRAKGDADATVLLLEHLMQLDGFGGKPKRPAKDPFAHLPSSIDRNSLSRLPESAGLYFFHDAGGGVLHVAASRSIRTAALKDLQTWGKPAARKQQLLESICDVTWEATGHELVAQLRLETERARMGAAAEAQREKSAAKYGVMAYLDQRGYMRTYVDKLLRGKAHHGEFATEADARAALEARVRRHGLCRQLTGMEGGAPGCSAQATQECAGACVGAEPAPAYNARVEAALQGLGFPHAAFFVLVDGRSHEEIAVVGMEQGEVAGYAYLDAAQPWDDPQRVRELLHPVPSTPAAKAILRQFLSKHHRAQLIPY